MKVASKVNEIDLTLSREERVSDLTTKIGVFILIAMMYNTVSKDSLRAITDSYKGMKWALSMTTEMRAARELL